MRVSFIERGIMAYSSIGYNYKSKLFLCQKTVHNIEYRRMRNDSHMENEVVNGKPLFQQLTLKSLSRCSGTAPRYIFFITANLKTHYIFLIHFVCSKHLFFFTNKVFNLQK